MRNAAENVDCHIIKDPPDVFLRAAQKIKTLHGEVKEKRETTKSTTKVKGSTLAMNSTTLETRLGAVRLNHII